MSEVEVQKQEKTGIVRYICVIFTCVIGILSGLIVALIYILVLRGQLKSVAPNESAADYVVKGSLHVTNSREFFLYHTLHRTVRAESSSSGGGGGSSTHRSSSGATHGGGGGKF